ncbi:hypothetical protein JCM10914A_02530 [Paenibacillus sp. JCM 10914]
MDLNVNKWLIRYLYLSTILLFLSIVVFLLHHDRYSPSGIGFIWFIVVLGYAGFVGIVITDMITSATREIQGQIVHQQGETVHVSQLDGRLKKYRVHVPGVLQQLKKGQGVRISLTRLAQIPKSIVIVDSPNKEVDTK